MVYKVNKFYMSEFFHIFLYEKIPSRRELGQIPLADADIVAVESYMEYWPNILKMSITYSQPGDLLYVIKTHWSGEAL